LPVGDGDLVADELGEAVGVVPSPHPAIAIAASNTRDRFHMTPTV
jgi:hypothetical protein